MDRNSRVYANMGESKLPYVYMLMGEKKINPLHGYYQEMSGSVVRDSVATLPEDRKLLLFANLKFIFPPNYLFYNSYKRLLLLLRYRLHST